MSILGSNCNTFVVSLKLVVIGSSILMYMGFPRGRVFRPKPDGWKYKNHKAEDSDQMPQLIENHKAEY